MTGKELHERWTAYRLASNTEVAWQLLASSLDDERKREVAEIIERRAEEGKRAAEIEAARAQTLDPEG